MSGKNLLVELFVEELPPKALKKLGEAFAGVLGASLKSQGLAAPEATVSAFASPRRLAAHVAAVAERAADKAASSKLMPVAVGLLRLVGGLVQHAGHLHRQSPRRGIACDRGIGSRKALGLQAVQQHGAESIAQLLQRLGRQFFDKEFNEQVLGSHGQAAFFASWAATSSAQALGAMGKPSRARLSR